MDSCVDWLSIDTAAAVQSDVHSLATLHKGDRGTVSAVTAHSVAPLAIGDGAGAGSTITRRLLELGFVPGERVEVVEEIRPGGDPIAVRIGSSIFALRRREARDVMVLLEPPRDP
jgi:ferrous iron transport protein A